MKTFEKILQSKQADLQHEIAPGFYPKIFAAISTTDEIFMRMQGFYSHIVGVIEKALVTEELEEKELVEVTAKLVLARQSITALEEMRNQNRVLIERFKSLPTNFFSRTPEEAAQETKEGEKEMFRRLAEAHSRAVIITDGNTIPLRPQLKRLREREGLSGGDFAHRSGDRVFIPYKQPGSNRQK